MSINYTYRNLEYLPSHIFGFKIHISAHFKNYQDILELVEPYLDTKKITYKFVNNREDVYKIFSTQELAAETGKFITIYPSQSVLLDVLEELYDILTEEQGIYILSDRPYKDSKVLFYRFGLFRDNANVYQDGIPTLTNLDGEEWQDYPKPYFDLPTWIPDIQEPPKEQKESYLGDHYQVTSVLHQSGGGNVYLGYDKKFASPIILKEVRPYILSFYDVEKKELREKEYEIATLLSRKGVKQVLSPIEKVDEWINSYYIYHCVEGESLVDFCKIYGLNSYSRNHKRKNLRLFQQFLGLVKSMIETILYFHDNEFILNDIHPENFIVGQNGLLHFIDLENSYMVGEKPLVGIESRISLKEWNFLDGKQADFRKLGNMIIFLLARLTISSDSYSEVSLLDDLLNAYGIESNLSDLIDYLLSQTVDVEHLKGLSDSLSAKTIDTTEMLPELTTSHLPNFLDRVQEQCVAFHKYQTLLNTVSDGHKEDEIIRLMTSERNLGMAGLSGVITLLHHNGLSNLAHEGIAILLNRLEETDEGLLVPIDGGFYSPYVFNGLAGVIQMLYYVNREQYRQLILQLRKSLCVEFAQYEGYDKGMLGIADTLLLTATYRNSKYLKQCIESLILNSSIYHNRRKLSKEDLQYVLFHYHDVYSF